MIVKIKDKEYSFDGYAQPLQSIQQLAEECYEQGRAEAIDEFAKPVINGTLHTICRMIASGDIPTGVYQKWLSHTKIGFMTPLEIFAEIFKEQLKSQK